MTGKGIHVVMYFRYILMGLSCYTLNVNAQNTTSNSKPKLEINSSAIKGGYERGSMVYYTLKVTDEEDGFSDYDEIAPAEVFLKVRYVKDTMQLARYLEEESGSDPMGLTYARKLSCVTCHAVRGPLIGPSFTAIAEKYGKDRQAPEYLLEKVVKGTTGTWGEQIMPPHPGVARSQIMDIIQWILTDAADAAINYFTGLSGAFRTNESQSGVYIIKATYTDHGDTGTPFSGKTGTAIVVIRPGEKGRGSR